VRMLSSIRAEWETIVPSVVDNAALSAGLPSTDPDCHKGYVYNQRRDYGPSQRSSHQLSATDDGSVIVFGGETAKGVPADSTLWLLPATAMEPYTAEWPPVNVEGNWGVSRVLSPTKDTLFSPCKTPSGTQPLALDSMTEEAMEEEGPWRALETAGVVPTPRIAHAQAILRGMLYVFGGREGAGPEGEGKPLADMYRIDLDELTWQAVEPFKAAASPLNRGMIPQAPMSPNAKPRVQAASLVPSVIWPCARSHHCVVAAPETGMLYMFGGCGEKERLNDLHEFHAASETWDCLPHPTSQNKLLCPRGGASMGLVGSRLFVVGGNAGFELGDLHSFDLHTQHWTTHNIPGFSPRSVFGMAALQDGSLAVFGGEADPDTEASEGFLDDVMVLDTAQMSWCKAELSAWGTCPPCHRAWGAAAAVGGQSMLVFGGIAGTTEHSKRFNDIHRLTLIG